MTLPSEGARGLRSLISEENRLWENTESPAYLKTLAHQKSFLERAVPYLVVALSILMVILFPLAISTNARLKALGKHLFYIIK